MNGRVRWGIIGCGEVTEVKSGPGFQNAEGSELVAVMRRDFGKAQDYARRHHVARAYASADDLIADPDVDAVYIATTPSSHVEIALRVAAAGKPCLVEKPMGVNHAECVRMVAAFKRANAPLWVAYYRRALPRFLEVRRLITSGAIGRPTSAHIRVTTPLATGEQALGWRYNPAVAGAGLFLDLASHCVDLIDFLVGPITAASGHALGTGGGPYAAEDVTAASFRVGDRVVGTGIWNFHADRASDEIRVLGDEGELLTPVLTDGDVTLTHGETRTVHPFRNPPHVHQPLIQAVVNELLGGPACESTGESGARASWVMDRCLGGYYADAVR